MQNISIAREGKRGSEEPRKKKVKRIINHHLFFSLWCICFELWNLISLSLNVPPHQSGFWMLYVKWKLSSRSKLKHVDFMVWTLSTYNSDGCCSLVTSLARTRPYHFPVFVWFSLWHCIGISKILLTGYMLCMLHIGLSKTRPPHTQASIPGVFLLSITQNQPYQYSGQG